MDVGREKWTRVARMRNSPHNAPGVGFAGFDPRTAPELAQHLLPMVKHASDTRPVLNFPSPMLLLWKNRPTAVFAIIKLILRVDRVVQWFHVVAAGLVFISTTNHIHILELLLCLPNAKPHVLGRSLLLRLQPRQGWIHTKFHLCNFYCNATSMLVTFAAARKSRCSSHTFQTSHDWQKLTASSAWLDTALAR